MYTTSYLYLFQITDYRGNMSSKFQFTKAFYEMMGEHESALVYWDGEKQAINKLLAELSNHKEQFDTFSSLHVNHLAIAEVFPDIRLQLLDKLNSKILEAEAVLNKYLKVIELQNSEISRLSELSQVLASELHLEVFLEEHEFKPTVGSQIEVCYDLQAVYKLQFHRMSTFVARKHEDKSVFEVADNLAKVPLPPKYTMSGA